EADLLLEADDPLDLGAHAAVVRRPIDVSRTELRARLANLSRLWVRPDGRGREEGQLEACALRLAANLELIASPGVVVSERRHPVAHGRVASSVGVAT